jgi:hypothetical protein
MRGKIMLGVLVAAITGAAVAVPLAASADRDHRLVIGVRVNFVSATHADGTFAACCAVNDDGAAQADITAFSVKYDNTGAFEAIETFAGSKGSFRLTLRGTTGPLSSLRHIARGRWSVLDGTGAYAGMKGEGNFTAVTDETNGAHGALTAINDGEAQG